MADLRDTAGGRGCRHVTMLACIQTKFEPNDGEERNASEAANSYVLCLTLIPSQLTRAAPLLPRQVLP